jgi:hypothetical protein
VRRGILRAFVIGRAVRVSPEAVAEAERLLAAPVPGGRRRQAPDHGVAREVLKLLEADR